MSELNAIAPEAYKRLYARVKEILKTPFPEIAFTAEDDAFVEGHAHPGGFLIAVDTPLGRLSILGSQSLDLASKPILTGAIHLESSHSDAALNLIKTIAKGFTIGDTALPTEELCVPYSILGVKLFYFQNEEEWDKRWNAANLVVGCDHIN